VQIPWVWLILVGAGMTALGAWPLVIGVRDIRMGRRSGAWPTAPGRVTASKIVVGKYASFFVDYRYEVAGISYDGDVLQPGQPALSRAQAEALEEQYAVGTAVSVHYDPDRPAKSVLIPGMASGGPWWAIALGALLIVSGVGFVGAAVYTIV
jgi:Protein of unknown function (DUF3592)